MKANEFVKKFGWDFSKDFSLKSNEIRKSLPNDIGEGFCIDLKRLVESHALVESKGGLDAQTKGEGMNLIKELGGYEKAKVMLQAVGHEHDAMLLEYRRQHNIFEVGDKVVIESYRNTYISCGRPSQYSIGDLMVIHDLDGNVISDDDYNFIDYRDVRHATDAEIKAGYKL